VKALCPLPHMSELDNVVKPPKKFKVLWFFLFPLHISWNCYMIKMHALSTIDTPNVSLCRLELNYFFVYWVANPRE
jgi:hypothetical protein